MDAEECRRRIEKCFPQFQIRSFKPNEEGWDFFVLEVNDDFIFRFPRRPDGVVYLERESALLPKLAQVLSVRVPQFEYIYNGGEKCAPFVGYRKIEGVPLTKELLQSIQSNRLTQQITCLLSELHRFPTQQAVKSNVPYANAAQWRQQYCNLYVEVRERVFPLLNTSARTKAILLWENFLNIETHFQFASVLLHKDLSGGHILCEPSGEQIAGIIDWGDLSIGDPAYDFTGLWRVYGSHFVEEVLAGYESKVDQTFRERIAFYSSKISFHKVLYRLHMRDSVRLELGLHELHTEIG